MNETNHKHVAAFFDFDGTLLVKDSAELGLRWAWKNKKASKFFIAKLYMFGLLYKIHLISAETISNIAIKFYKDQNMSELNFEAENFYKDWLKPHISKSILQKAKEHRAKGHKLIILSTFLEYILQVVAKDLGFDYVVGTRLETDSNGLGTGEPVGAICVGDDKKKAALKIAHDLNIDLEKSYMYSDHQSDIPLLNIVGYPIVVRPSLPLKRYAIKKNWQILT